VISLGRFRLAVHLLSQGASRRTVMRQASICGRMTVDWIAQGKHPRQLKPEQYKAEENEVRCPCCRRKWVKLPCPICSTIKFRGI
jgi:hypothetical protein